MKRYSLLLALLCAVPAYAQDAPFCGSAFAPADMHHLAAMPMAEITGEQRAVLILVNFRDSPSQPYTAEYARNALQKTDAFFRENSKGTVSFSYDVLPWATIDHSYNGCDPMAIMQKAQASAVARGVNLTQYNRYIVAFPAAICGWWGLGTVGGNPSLAWVQGMIDKKVLAHELGHNLSLYHSNAWTCAGGTLTQPCKNVEYGGQVCTMSMGAKGHFNAFQKERLGWLAPLVVTRSGEYALSPYEHPAPTAPQALKISAGGKTYYAEYRQPIGEDAWMAGNANLERGVVVHMAEGVVPLLLDLQPKTAGVSDPALLPGETFVAPGLRVSLLSSDASGATIRVETDTVTPPPVVPPPVIPPPVVTPPPPPPPPPSSGTTLHLVSDKTSYRLKETAIVTVTLRRDGRPVPGQNIEIALHRPGMSPLFRKLRTGANGTDQTRFQLTLSWPTGTYAIYAQIGGLHATVLKFEVRK